MSAQLHYFKTQLAWWYSDVYKMAWSPGVLSRRESQEFAWLRCSRFVRSDAPIGFCIDQSSARPEKEAHLRGIRHVNIVLVRHVERVCGDLDQPRVCHNNLRNNHNNQQ